MTEAELFALAEHSLADVIAQVRPGQEDEAAPAGFSTNAKESQSLRQVIAYHAYDSAWVPDTLAGRTIAEVGDRHEHLKTDESVDYRVYSDAAAAAALDHAGDLDRTVHLTYGDLPAREYLLHCTTFRGFRVVEIARWIGVSTRMPDALVDGMWELIGPRMDEWRAFGVFGPEIAVPHDAPLQQRLLGRAGRDPHM